MHRVLKNTRATLSVTFEIDGTGTNPTPDDEATVTVTRADGTVLVDNQAATNEADGLFTYTIEAAENDRLDILTAEWTSDLGTLTTVTEVAGGFLFTIAELRAKLQSEADYSTPEIVAVRNYVEDALETACNVAFVPRYRRETISGTGSPDLYLAPRTTAIRSLLVDGVSETISGETYSDITGHVYWPDTWPAGTSNLVVGYEHGYAHPPEIAKDAALTWAKIRIVRGPIDDRMTSMSNEHGTFALSTPGMSDVVSGIPSVDEAIRQLRVKRRSISSLTLTSGF